MKGKCIIFGVTGSIAAFKAAELCSLLTKRGAEVHAILTPNACKLISPSTFYSLSRNPVHTETFSESHSFPPPHISLSDKADLMVIAPATANTIAKIACGIADDLLLSTVVACQAPLLIAPAMNVRMFSNPILQENLQKLKSLGYVIVEPESGPLADGSVGKGRLASVESLAAAIEEIFE